MCAVYHDKPRTLHGEEAMGEDLLRAVRLLEVEEEGVWARPQLPMDLLIPEPKSKRPGSTPTCNTHSWSFTTSGRCCLSSSCESLPA